MAYTYDDFVTAAQGAGMYDSFSQDDLTIAQKSPEYGLSMLKLQQDANKASTPEQKLLVQEALNQLRTTYTGSAAPTSSAASAPTSTGKTSAKGYQYSGQDAYEKALAGVTGYGDYSYDKGKDPLFGSMKDNYLTDIETSKDKLLGSFPVSGNGSMLSYAGAAAGQSGNYYGTRLNDVVPEVEQNAWEQYLKNFGIKSDQLAVMAADRNFDLGKYMQRQELDLQAAQQKFENELLLHQMFGTEVPSMPSMSGLGSGKDSAYTYERQNEFQEALDAVMNQEAHSYDLNSDPTYGVLQKSFRREGRRAGEDALARASAGSMGVPSSYAIRVAADAENAYNEQLMGAAPELEMNDYERYLSDFANKVSTLGSLETDRAGDYDQWLKKLQLDRQKKQAAFDNAMALYQVVGLTPEIAAVLGVPYVEHSSGGDDDDGGSGYRPSPNGKQLSPYAQVLKDVRDAQASGASNSQLNKIIMTATNEGKIHQNQAQQLKSGYIKRK